MGNGNLTLKYWFFHSWRVYKNSLARILAATLIFSTFGWITWWLAYLPYGTLISRVSAFVLGPPLVSGFSFFCLKVVREKSGHPKDFMAGFLHFGSVWVTHFLLMVILAVGLALLMIPGILWSCKYCFSIIGVLDRRLSPFQALKFSGAITYGYKTKLFLLFIPALVLLASQLPLAYILQDPTRNCGYTFVALGITLYLVGNFILSPWMFVVWATAYNALSKRYENDEPH